ncbi:uncharacterized protein TM35_000541040 [Trypanosoma theileri]|uniref:Uncharacterized protein n=1 Tax=Trypanosoma theileri TaxID=67003 RepID=A0A1X0NIF7_9TRYP|nr:uncharacterized protein TM35_000541040 [Trypanosoma theileri]ORC83880.1 hypothetical protein TM35_000541040 [Trypanosoma theileri]
MAHPQSLLRVCILSFPFLYKRMGMDPGIQLLLSFLFLGLQSNALTHLTLRPLYGVCGHILLYIAIEATTMLLYDGATLLVHFVFFTWVVFSSAQSVLQEIK